MNSLWPDEPRDRANCRSIHGNGNVKSQTTLALWSPHTVISVL